LRIENEKFVDANLVGGKYHYNPALISLLKYLKYKIFSFTEEQKNNEGGIK
jgi:hypothetical protein